MRKGWDYKKLGEVCEIQYGFAFDSSFFCEDDNYPQLIRIRDVVRGYSETYYKGVVPEGYYIEKGDLLIGMDGEFNIAPWKSEKALLNQRVCKIYASDNTMLDRFIYYQMQIILKHIEDETPFVTVKHLSAKRLNSVELPVPSLAEQQSIVSELDKINELISLKKAQLSDLDTLAQSIFYEMFGDPIENEKGWEVKKLGEVAEPTIGLTYKPDNVTSDGTGTIVLRSSNIQESKLDFEDIVRVNIPIKNNKYVKDGDILMCSRNGSFKLVGKVAMIHALTEKMSYGAFMTIIRSEYNPYLFGYFKTSAFREYLIQGKTTTVNQITVQMLRDINIPLPPLPLQQSFARKIEAIEQQKTQITATIKDLETLLASRMQYWFD